MKEPDSTRPQPLTQPPGFRASIYAQIETPKGAKTQMARILNLAEAMLKNDQSNI